MLPKGFFALAKQVVQKRRDAVGQRVGVQVVVQRIVAVFGIEADLDVVVAPSVALKNLLYLPAEVTLDLQDDSANALFFALQNIRVGGSNAVYLHFRASFTDYYDTDGAYEWRIARVAIKLLTDVLTEGPVRDVRTGSGSWFDDMMQRITNMPIAQVLTVRIKEVP